MKRAVRSDVLKLSNKKWLTSEHCGRDRRRVGSRRSRVKLEIVENSPVGKRLISQADVPKIVEKVMKVAMGKLDDCVINIAEQTVVDAFETCVVDHYKAFNECKLKCALIALLVSILDGSSGTGKFY